MVETALPNIPIEAQSLAIEEYLPYAISMFVASRSNKAEKKNTPYVWESLVTQAKKPFSSVQIEFELAMTMINYAFTLANLSAFTARSYFKELKTNTKTSAESQELAKKCNHLYRRAAGVLEYVKNNLIPVLFPGVPLPIETEIPVCVALIDTLLGLAQMFTIMIGKETNVNVGTIARVVMGANIFLSRAYTVFKTRSDSKNKSGASLAPPFVYNLEFANTHYNSLAFFYVAESFFKKDLVESAPAVAFYNKALELNIAARKFKVFVGSAADLETVAAFGTFLQEQTDIAVHDNKEVYYKEAPAFEQVTDMIPQEAMVTKPMDYEVPSLLCSEIR